MSLRIRLKDKSENDVTHKETAIGIKTLINEKLSVRSNWSILCETRKIIGKIANRNGCRRSLFFIIIT